MEFSIIEFSKICGILFFIMVAWYFAFVVFKTNKDFLSSIVHQEENPTSLSDFNSLFGTSLKEFVGKEGFVGKKGASRLSNEEEKLTKILNKTIAEYNLDDDGKKDTRTKITSILEKRTKLILLLGVGSMVKNNHPLEPAAFKHAHEGAKYILALWKKQTEKLDGGDGGGGWI